jgi:cysteinyl-tRNA synthetase
MVFVRDLLARYSPDALRLYLLGTPYREPLDFDEGDLQRAARVAESLAEAAGARGRGPGAEIDARPFALRVDEALDEDLDTPTAIASLDELASRILASGDADTYSARRTLRRLVSRLGLSLAPMR